MRMLYKRVCPQCGQPFRTDVMNKIYCCDLHKKRAEYHRHMSRREGILGERYRDRIAYISAKTKATRKRVDRCARCSGPADMAPLRVCSKCRDKLGE